MVATWAAEHGAPLHAHVSEQPAENEACLEENALTPTMTLAEAGAVSPRFTAVHATHLADNDVALLGFARVCLCPTTERDLADGIGPARQLREAGRARCASAATRRRSSTSSRRRARSSSTSAWPPACAATTPPAQLLAAATAGGYDSLGWPGGGRIADGAPADLVTVSLDGVALAGTREDDAVAATVFAARRARRAPRDGRRAAGSCATARTSRSTSPRELNETVGTVPLSLVIDNIGLLVTNDAETRRACATPRW